MRTRTLFFGVQAKSALVIFLLFGVITAPVQAAITTNGIAIDSLGQYNGESISDPMPSYTKSVANDAPNRLGFNGVFGGVVDSVNDRFFQADQNNHRVLVFNLNPDGSLVDHIPDGVLGQPDFVSNSAALTQSGLTNPGGLTLDPVRGLLFVAQGISAHRISIFDVNDITNGENAINVLGQADFTSNALAISASGMDVPYGMAYDTANNYLYVGDLNANRVTVFDLTTITDGENAIHVLGQPDFTSSVGAVTQAGINSAHGLAFDPINERLFVVNFLGNRVTVYDVATITDGENAINVLGQALFTTSAAANTQAGLNLPSGLAYDIANQRLFVGQSGSHRVTVFDVSAIADGEAAVNVIGQANFTAATAATTQIRLNNPFDLAYDQSSDRLYVSNFGAHRVTIYDVSGIVNGEAAIDLLGQYDGTSSINPIPVYTRAAANDAPNRLGYNQPQGLVVDRANNRLFVADTSNHRVLIYDVSPDGELLDRIPDRVLGQATFATNAAAITQVGMNGPSGMAYDPTKNLLYVLNVNRVTVYDVASITNGEPAVNVLGQATFTANTAGNTQAGMNSPRGIALDVTGQRLFVSQNGNNRVTVYDVSTIVNGENATNVLGQFTFTATAASSTASGLSAPRGVAYDPNSDRLFVASSGNHRVTVFDVSTITNGEPATNIIGQPSFATTAAAITQVGLSTPTGIAYDEVHDRLFVANLTAHRITVYDTSAITDGMNASHVFGQPDFTTGTFNNSQQGINAATALAFDTAAQRLYAGQLGNHRVSVFDTSIAGYSITESGGSTEVTENGATDTFEVVLTAPTLDSVTIQFQSSDNSASTTVPFVTFTSTTWDIPQTVTVYGPTDADTVDGVTTITASVDPLLSDAGFILLTDQVISVNVTDEGVIIVPPAPIIPTGGGSAIYGCKDRNAINYNPNATLQNHNSCQYAVAPLPVLPPPVIIPTPTPEAPVCKITKLPTKPIRLGTANDPEQVKLLEAYLNAELGLTLPIDGIYAKTDMDAVIAWQERYAPEILQPWGITKGTGIVSTFSLKKLASIQSSQCHPATTPAPKTCFVTTGNLVRGDNSSDILRLQKILAKQGYLKVTPNGNFGPSTYAAVIAFQAINNIEQTGTVGPLTKQAFKTLNLCN